MTSIEQSVINSYNSIKNAFKMLKNRGYIINDKDDFKQLLGDIVDDLAEYDFVLLTPFYQYSFRGQRSR